MARNGHKSAFASLVLRGARPAYVPPIFDDVLELTHAPDPARLADALQRAPDAVAGLLFTPSYYGKPRRGRAGGSHTIPGHAWTYWNKGLGPSDEDWLTTTERAWSIRRRHLFTAATAQARPLLPPEA
jgi:hypothetical protein